MRTNVLNFKFEISNLKFRAKRTQSSERGYLLLAVMLLITIMMVMLAIEAPRIGQQIKREKEEELVFRGKQYATAIKRFYHKNGTYPLSLEQLEDTNHLRFLRKRYKDPMTTDGEWKLVHVGEAQLNIPTPLGTPGQPGQAGTLGTITPSGTPAPSPSPSPGAFGGGANTGLGGGLGSGGLGSGLGGGAQPGPGGRMGTLATQNIGTSLGGSSVGGGPIIGVVSTSKKTSIKEFNGNSEYDEWLFVYDPRGEQAGGGGVFIAAPLTGATPPPGAPGAPPSGSPAPGPGPSPAPQPSLQQ